LDIWIGAVGEAPGGVRGNDGTGGIDADGAAEEAGSSMAG
jgi:hypothetical protein